MHLSPIVPAGSMRREGGLSMLAHAVLMPRSMKRAPEHDVAYDTLLDSQIPNGLNATSILELIALRRCWFIRNNQYSQALKRDYTCEICVREAVYSQM